MITAARCPARSDFPNSQFLRLCMAVHNRKNWLFAGSDDGGERAVTVMSLIQSAKLNGYDPYRYLKDVWSGYRPSLPVDWRSSCPIVGNRLQCGKGDTTLADIVRDLRRYDEEPIGWQEPTIYAEKPWSASSPAIVSWSEPKGGLPGAVTTLRLVRLMDVRKSLRMLKDEYDHLLELTSSGTMYPPDRAGPTPCSNRDPYMFRQ